MSRIVCYTCITGCYDKLKQPQVVTQNVDYVCFTDNISLSSTVWQMRWIPDELKHLSDVKKQRIIKICPHRYLAEYNVSIWVDGNIQVKNDLDQFIAQYDLEKCPLYTRVHPHRKCIYAEAEACIQMRKGNADVIKEQVDAYMKEGYPRNAGMVETNVMLRKHNDIRCKLLCNLWAVELLKHSHRDQLSFNYACWKMHFLPGILKNEFKILSNDTFRICKHG